MTTIRIKLLFVSIFFLSISFAAEKNNPNNNIIAKVQHLVSVENGMLTFADNKDANLLMEQLIKLTAEELLIFENNLVYRSLSTLLYESELADNEYYKSFLDEGYSVDDLLSMIENGKIMPYSEFTMKLISAGTFMKITFENGSTGLDVSIHPDNSLIFINANGKLCIADLVYRYDKNETTVSLNTNESKANNYFGETVLFSGDNENCESQGCVRLISSLEFNKFWYWDVAKGWETKIKVYINNAMYKYSWWNWRRQSSGKYTASHMGKLNLGVDGLPSRTSCYHSSGLWGGTVSINYSEIGDYKEIDQWNNDLIDGSDCANLGSGYIDLRKITFQKGTSILSVLDQTDNGENIHPTVLLLPPSSKNSWDDVIMEKAK